MSSEPTSERIAPNLTYTVVTKRAGAEDDSRVELVPSAVRKRVERLEPSWAWLGSDMTSSDAHLEVWYADGVGTARIWLARPRIEAAPTLLFYDDDGFADAITQLLAWTTSVGVTALISAQVELLLSQMLSDLQVENSALRSALETARIEIAFLEGELKGLREAMAMGRPTVQKAKMKVISAILLALLSGAAAGGTQQAVVELSSTSAPVIHEYHQRCEQVIVMMNQSSDQDPRAEDTSGR